MTCPVCGSRLFPEPVEVFFGAPYRQFIPGPLACPNVRDDEHMAVKPAVNADPNAST